MENSWQMKSWQNNQGGYFRTRKFPLNPPSYDSLLDASGISLNRYLQSPMSYRPFLALLLCAFFVCALAPVTHAQAGRKALLVAIDQYPDPAHHLFGCVNDLRLMRLLLEETYGFAPEDIVELTNAQATTRNLLQAIRSHLIEGTSPEDLAFFFFAGHGTGVKDFDGDEADGIDEAIVTYDFDPLKSETWFTDDLIFELFQRIPAGRVVAIHDCCHSGSGNRGAGSPASDSVDPKEVKYRFTDAGFRSFDLTPPAGISRPAHSMLTVAQPPGHVFLAACRDDQLAAEAMIGENRHGLFTVNIVRAFHQNPGMSLEAVAEKVRDDVVRISTEVPNMNRQDPVSEVGGHRAIPLRDLLGPDPVAAPAASAAVPASGEGIPLHRPPTLDEVAPGYRPSGGIGVVLTTNKIEYAQNELMQIELLTDRDAYVELYYYGVDDQVYRLFPNGFAADNFVKAGKKVQIPGNLGFDLRLHLPDDFEGVFGNEVLKAVASTRPFSEEESTANKDEVFRQIDGTKLNPAESRLIEIRAAAEREFGEAMLIYRIRK